MAKNYDVRLSYRIDGEQFERTEKTAASKTAVALKVARRALRAELPGASIDSAEIVFDVAREGEPESEELTPVEAEAFDVVQSGATPLEEPEHAGAEGTRDLPFAAGDRVLVNQPSRPATFGTVDYCVDATWVRVFTDRSAVGEGSSLFAAIDVTKLTPKQIAGLDAQAEPEADRPAPKRRRGHAASAPAAGRRKETQADLDASNGKLPARPEIISPTNQHVVGRFVKLEKLALDGNWAAVEASEVKGGNTYAKKLARYRDQLLTAHSVQQNQKEAERDAEEIGLGPVEPKQEART